jgi:hypothetical protein
MVKGSSIARLKKRAQQPLEKDPNDRTYKEVKDISNWTAVTERWEEMKGNQYATGIVRSAKTREMMRAAHEDAEEEGTSGKNAKCDAKFKASRV